MKGENGSRRRITPKQKLINRKNRSETQILMVTTREGCSYLKKKSVLAK